MIRRARLTLFVAMVLAAVIVGAELPIGQLVHESSSLASASAQLRQLQAENRALSAAVHSLGQDSTVAKLAHEQYLLVKPGQRAYVILPTPSDNGSTPGPLTTSRLPTGVLVPSDAAIDPTAPAPAAGAEGSPGTWQQVLNRLEFWRWAL